MRAFTAVAIWSAFLANVAAVDAPLAEVGPVFVARFNHDASRVVVRTRDGEVGLWNAATGAVVPGDLHTSGQGLVMSADGKMVLVSFEGGGAQIFSADTGEARSPRLEVRCRVSESPEAVFSPDGKCVIVFESAAARVIAVENGEIVGTFPFRAVAVGDDEEFCPSAAFTGDGAQCFIMDAKGLVTRYDATSWKPLGPPMKHPAAPSAWTFAFALSRDGRWLATFDSPGENGPKANLQTWDVTKGQPLGKPIVAVNGITGTFFANSERLLVSPARGEGSVRGLPSLKQIFGVRAHDQVEGPSMALSPDGKWIVSWGADRVIHLLTATTGTVQDTRQFDARISQVLILPDSSGCLVTFDNTVFLAQDHYDNYVIKFRFPDLEPTHSLRVTESMSDLTLSPDGRRFLAFVGKGDAERVRVFEAADLKPVSP